MKTFQRSALFLLLVVFQVTLAEQTDAALPQQSCSACHTMHNSQNGSLVIGGGALPSLLRSDCLGCHTGTNTATETTPYVYSTTAVPLYQETGTEADSNTLAGGNFYWAAQAGQTAFGHNVAGIRADETLLVPPGFDGGRLDAAGHRPAGGSWTSGAQVTCAGIYGCHGNHNTTSETAAVAGGHHSGVGGAITTQSTTAAGSYRMLVGILGYEEPGWEFRPSETEHNVYKGVDAPGNTDDSTISYFCAQCHGQYHDGSANIGTASPWLRHPTDLDMSSAKGTEYQDYGGGAHAYKVVTPVGRSTIPSTPPGTIDFTGTNAIVTCLSCHRAHGSKYYKSMRWDYAGSPTGSLNSGEGCANCHTTKD